MMPAAVPWRY